MAKRTPKEISERLSEKPLCELRSEVLKLRAIVRELETKIVGELETKAPNSP
jgi:hypothetical protein